ncbi:MAG: primosomal protein N' [Pseudomonadota bacterium]
MPVNNNSIKPDARYIEVAIPLPVYHTFTYEASHELALLAETGKRVLVPFGKRRLSGYVIGPGERPDRIETKSIEDVLDSEPLFPESMIPFFKWVSEYYMYPIGETIRCALPAGLDVFDLDLLHLTDKGKTALSEGSPAPLEERILKRLEERPFSRKSIQKQLKEKISNAVYTSLEKRGWIEKERILKSPTVKSKEERYVVLEEIPRDFNKFSEPRQRLLKALIDKGPISTGELSKIVPSASSFIRSLADRGIVKVIYRKVLRDPFGEPIRPDRRHVLTTDQHSVVSTVLSALGKGFSTFLLSGVTGSGKTEVYMQLVSESLKRGDPALILVPEIALISQMERRFRARFGDRIAVLHSALSSGERYDQWMRIRSNEAMVGIGARSALFAPFERIGIIIVDEEHDSSYKQESQLLYHARDMAVVRAMLLDTVALLGSATPSTQSHYNVRTGKFVGLTLPNRIERRPLPEVTIVDLRNSMDFRGTGRFMTGALINGIKDALRNKEQVLLFLNRRGYANFPVCSACGNALTCRNCDISLTYHKGQNLCICHLCGYSHPFSTTCRICGAPKVRNLGIGTEKVEAAVKSLFPKAAVARMDRDTTRKKGSLLALLKGLKNRTIDILVGTQMVAKGHDFPYITLVGIICADLSLDLPDFRASERTFQLLAQVSGRAGRGGKPGRVILQTYAPAHFTITSAKEQNDETFFQKEIQFRKNLNYPPFSHIMGLKISGKNKEKTRNGAMRIGEMSSRLQTENLSYRKGLEVLGPSEAPLSKIANRYRWQIFLKSSQIKILRQFASDLLFRDGSRRTFPHVQVTIDVDPYDMM